MAQFTDYLWLHNRITVSILHVVGRDIKLLQLRRKSVLVTFLFLRKKSIMTRSNLKQKLYFGFWSQMPGIHNSGVKYGRKSWTLD